MSKSSSPGAPLQVRPGRGCLRRTGVPLRCHPAWGHQLGGDLPVLFRRAPPRHAGQLLGARRPARVGEPLQAQLDQQLPALAADCRHFAGWRFGGRLPVGSSAPGAEHALAAGRSPGAVGWQRPASAAAWAGRSSSWRFQAAVSGRLFALPGGDHGRATPARLTESPWKAGQQPRPRGSHSSGAPGVEPAPLAGQGWLVGHGAPAADCRRCAPAGGWPSAAAPRHLFHQRGPPPRVAVAQAASPWRNLAKQATKQRCWSRAAGGDGVPEPLAGSRGGQAGARGRNAGRCAATVGDNLLLTAQGIGPASGGQLVCHQAAHLCLPAGQSCCYELCIARRLMVSPPLAPGSQDRSSSAPIGLARHPRVDITIERLLPVGGGSARELEAFRAEASRVGSW